MIEYYGSFGLAGVLGLAVSGLLAWLIPRRPRLRVAILLVLPLTALLLVFLAFFDWAPEGEDWFWLAVGLQQFWPWYLTWGAGSALAWLAVAKLRRARG
jgi:hypothetical protein